MLNWRRQDIEALASDEAVRSAGEELAWSAQWTRVGRVDALFWGEYRGSGRGLYRVVVEPGERPPLLTRVECTCPSRKRPCKHALGLLLQVEAGLVESGDPGTDPVEWVRDAPDAPRRAAATRAGGRAIGKSARPRSRPADQGSVQREQRVLAGLEELDDWLTNLLAGGLALAINAVEDWERMAKRLVDAQAPGLAARLRRAAGLRGELSSERLPARLLEELAILHLASSAFQRLASLSKTEQADLRAFIGWSQRRELTLESAPRRDLWQVMGIAAAETAPVRVRRIWLQGMECREAALLIDYDGEMERDLRPGLTIAGELRYFPGGWPLRAVLDHDLLAEECSTRLSGETRLIEPALRRYAEALASNPWLEHFPMLLAGIELRQFDGDWFVVDRQGDRLPLATVGRSALTPWRILALGGGAPLDLFGEWDGRAFRALTVLVGERLTDLATGIGGE